MELVLVVTAVVISLLLYLLLRWCLRDILDEVVGLPAARRFYLRTLLLVLILVAVASTIDNSVSVDAGDPFMTVVWEIAESLQVFFISLVFVLMTYAVLLTILVAALRRRNEQ